MSDEHDNEPTHRPKPEAKLQPLAYQVGCGFFPPIKLDRKSGLEFAATLSDYVDTSRMKLDSNQWTLTGGLGSTDGLEVVITQTSIQLKVKNPPKSEEWYEEKYQIILNRFEQAFEPKMILGSTAMIRGLMDIDGDSRAFIGACIMNISPDDFDIMKRPLHLLGVRFFFPPYEARDEETDETVETADWGVNVKIESWIEDPQKIFLEADAKWQEPEQWSEDAVGKVVARLETASDFIRKKVHAFLMQKPTEDGDQT